MRKHKKWCIKLHNFVITAFLLSLLYGTIPLMVFIMFYVIPFWVIPYME